MRAPFPLLLARRASHRAGAGFTLVELMVSMTGGLFLAIVVFALSRDASRFYQRESRVANATLASVTGFERLSADVARAGHMVTANIASDPRVCNRPAAVWPAMLQSLRAVVVEEPDTLNASTEVGEAGITPHGIVIAGAMNTPEVLTTAAVSQTGGGNWQVSLNTSTPAAERVGLSPDNGALATNLAAMQAIFMAPGGNGRIIRLRKKGEDQYAVAASVATAVGPETALALVTLAAAPALTRPVDGGTLCGIEGLGKDMDVSVIDLVRYNIRPMVGDATYAALFRASGLNTGGGSSTSALPYEAKRAELVRVELTPAGAEIASTREIVAEYAVDLQLSGWSATDATNPALVAVPAATLNNTYAGTQLLRGMHLRLSVRSREADRNADITGTGGGSNDRYRMRLTSPEGPVFARVRTLQTDIPLRNLENSAWN